MNIVLASTDKNLPITEALDTMVRKELAFLEDILPADKVVDVTLKSKPEHKATIHLFFNKELFHLEESGEDLYGIFPALAKKLEKQLRNFKKMKQAFSKGRDSKEFTAMNPEEEDVKPVVAKRKRFEMKPMSESEAILQMESLGHPQFIFANAELDGQICLLYTRKDGQFGIIETTY
ncbi:ribosome hibernation promotion factor [Rossellomorea marisflavi]|uniref:ribosome hibernation promotion factor n=1 Tax=Rossellomorea marisflavi TaxID=189381 RepID=UPI003F9F3B55